MGKKCRSCGAEIKWMKTTAGKWIPVDVPGVAFVEDPAGDELFVVNCLGAVMRGRRRQGSGAFPIGYTSHFATCPNAAAHRKREKEGQ